MLNIIVNELLRMEHGKFISLTNFQMTLVVVNDLDLLSFRLCHHWIADVWFNIWKPLVTMAFGHTFFLVTNGFRIFTCLASKWHPKNNAFWGVSHIENFRPQPMDYNVTQFFFLRQVVIMLVIIMCVFAVCWLPFQIAILYAEHRSNTDIQVSSKPIK